MAYSIKEIKTGKKTIGQNSPCYIIAEMSANHAGELNRAIEIVHAAKEAGADCIKLQTYTPDTMTIDSDKAYFQVSKGTWNGENLYNLYQKAYTPWEWHEDIKCEAEKIGLDFLSTPFDNTSVDFLEDIGISFYKIASCELVDLPLLKYVASKGKPIIMSTGMATMDEIKEAVKAIRDQGNQNICLLRCSSAYPAIPDDMNLATIRHLQETFGVPVGLSDHTMGSISAITAVALGAKVIEKHLCISRKISNPDSSFSMEPSEFKTMVEEIRLAEKAIGTISYDVSEREQISRDYRRSIFAVRDIKKGEKLSKENIRVIRPAYGLPPKYYENVVGKVAVENIERGTPLKWEMLE